MIGFHVFAKVWSDLDEKLIIAELVIDSFSADTMIYD
jgi:hypothetical protein